jgi:CDP-diacylglycerol---serine O-phosphatidyltransferase
MSIVRHIPNTITSCNLLCGVLGVIASFRGRPDIAFSLMLAASVFDFCDGLAARALKAYSDMGKELDSLSDMVSFGVLPSVMMCNHLYASYGNSIVSFVPVVLAVFSGLRLAKFNVDERQHSSFVGLATPAAALICASLCDFAFSEPDSLIGLAAGSKLFLPLLSVVLSALLVSEIPMFAMKMGTGDETPRAVKLERWAFLAAALLSLAATLVFGLHWSLVILATFVAYVVINFIAWPFLPKA